MYKVLPFDDDNCITPKEDEAAPDSSVSGKYQNGAFKALSCEFCPVLSPDIVIVACDVGGFVNGTPPLSYWVLVGLNLFLSVWSPSSL